MRRFRQEDLFNRLAEAGRLTVAQMDELGEEIRAFHDEAERVEGGGGGAARMQAVIEENAEEFAERPDLFDPAEETAYDRQVRAALKDVAALLDRRREAGFVRRCHGDLHLRNICLIAGRPTLFDAIEFNDAIACVDVLYDLAFLLMDLDRRGLAAEANLVLGRYLRDEADYEGLAALPLFLSCRAAIRAKVAASAEASQTSAEARARKRADARDYFRAAAAYLETAPAVLVAVGGLSGSGKSRLAQGLAPGLGRAPGAVVLRSDVLRKRLFAVAEESRLPAQAYTPEAGLRVYGALRHLAGVTLRAGQSVIVDAVHARPEERAAVEEAAREAGVGFVGLWLEAPAEVLLARVGARRGDASDATGAVVRRQLDYEIGALTWHRLDAAGTPEDLVATARRHLAGHEA
jgi:predicted kinase